MAELTSNQVLSSCWPKNTIQIQEVSLAFTEYSKADDEYYTQIDSQTKKLFSKLNEHNILSIMEHRETASGGIN